MGISGLTKLIADRAPTAIKKHDITNFFGRKVAIDASMSIYQFLIAVRGQDGQVLQNLQGETTSHLLGLFYRTVRMVDSGIKPVYVFDGKPPTFKSGELAKRSEKRQEAQKMLDEAKEKGLLLLRLMLRFDVMKKLSFHTKAKYLSGSPYLIHLGDQEAVDRFSRRTVKVSREHNDECKKLLDLMGIPYVEAPCEAEAQCAALCKSGKVFASASEDMDTLTFGSPVLLRHLTYSEAKKEPILEIQLDVALAGLGLNMDQFVDLCIMMGCDYCDTIKGIGPTRAIALMQEHGSLEKVLENIDSKKYPIGANFDYESARALFLTPEVKDPSTIELTWKEPQAEELINYLVTDKGFNSDRVLKGIEKLKSNVSGPAQSRLDTFFTVKPKATPVGAPKRKAPATPAKKAKAGGGRPRR